MAAKEKWETNVKMENITLGWFILSWFQYDISKVLRNKEIGCFTHKPIRVQFSLGKAQFCPDVFTKI